MPDAQQPEADITTPPVADVSADSTPAEGSDRASRQAAKYRTERNALREQVNQYTAEAKAARALAAEERMAREKLAAEYAALQQTIASQREAAKHQALSERIRSGLAGVGITDPAQHDLLLPGLTAKVRAAGVAVKDDLSIEGDLGGILEAAIAPLTPQRGSQAARILAGQLPSEDETKPKSGAEALRHDLKKLRSFK